MIVLRIPKAAIQVSILGLLCLATLLSGCDRTGPDGAAAVPARGVTHVVLVWLDPALPETRVESIIQATAVLAEIDEVRALHFGRAVPSTRDLVDDSFTFGIILQFDSVEGMQRYQAHPKRDVYVREHVAGRAVKVIAYDF